MSKAEMLGGGLSFWAGEANILPTLAPDQAPLGEQLQIFRFPTPT